MQINFQPGKNHDIETLLILIEKFYEIDGYIDFNTVIVRRALNQLLNDDSMGRVWLIQDQNQAIGYIVLTFGYSLEYGGRDAFIDEFYIDPVYQGKGIGKQTIQFLEKSCILLNIQALHLEVARENTSAQGFYQRVGFEDHDRYLMTKRLKVNF